MRVLAIESSCDESAAAVLDETQGLLAHELYSQIDLHRAYGGVVPELASRDHVRKLLPLVKRALELKPDSGYIMDSLGWVYYKMGRFKESLKELLHARDTVGSDAAIYEHLGDVYKALGKPESAMEAWKKSLTLKEDEDGLRDRVRKKLRALERTGNAQSSRSGKD